MQQSAREVKSGDEQPPSGKSSVPQSNHTNKQGRVKGQEERNDPCKVSFPPIVKIARTDTPQAQKPEKMPNPNTPKLMFRLALSLSIGPLYYVGAPS